ncbi:MAG: hypothetical protein CMJ27_08220 [Phycisphaerae bacterium]|nr:hypothetical protein [Phycisphaerae bacterium]OUX93462.1 MAG: hypothetical protein CBB77_09335 [Hyphomonas sp. TMED17]
MSIDAPITLFGILMVFAPLAMILYNYLVAGDDLITARHLFLLGCAKFFGVAALTTGITKLYRGNHPFSDVLLLFLGTALFFLTFWWAYNHWQLPQRIAARRWRTSPTPNLGSVLFAGGAGLLLGLLASVLPVELPVIGQITNVLGKLLPAASIALFLFCWLKNPANLIYLVATGVAFMLAVFVALFGAGRHPLFAALIAIPIAWYWARWRYQRPSATIGRILALGIAAAVVILAYSGFRHDYMGEADSGIALDRIRQLMRFQLETSGDADSFLQEDAITVTLLCIEEFHRNGDPDYFHTLRFVLSNPIPRDLWPEKPQALGESLPEGLGEFSDGYVNWGTGIVGNAFHDGGVWMTIIYGLLVGGVFRVFDDILRRQPFNPWPVAMLAAMSPKIVAYSRGDIGIYTVELVGLAVVTIVILKVMKPVFGTTDEEAFHAEHPDDSDLEFEEPGYE